MRKIMRKQRRMGALLAVLAAGALIYMIATGGGDATGILVAGALGVWLLCTKECVLYEEQKGRRHG